MHPTSRAMVDRTIGPLYHPVKTVGLQMMLELIHFFARIKSSVTFQAFQYNKLHSFKTLRSYQHADVSPTTLHSIIARTFNAIPHHRVNGNSTRQIKAINKQQHGE